MKILYQLIIIVIFLLSGCNKETPQNKSSEVQQANETIEKYGFVKNIISDSGKYFAVIDFIDYLKNSEVDSTIPDAQKIELPNGYSYVNKKIKNEKLEIADSAKIILQTFSYDSTGNFNFDQPVKLNDIVKALQKNKNNIFLHSPFKIELADNKVIGLTEIYIP